MYEEPDLLTMLKRYVHPSVEISRAGVGDHVFTLRDLRTSMRLRIELTTPSELDQLPKLLRDAGLVDDLSNSKLRQKQRAFLLDCRRRERDEDLVELISYATEHVPYYREHAAEYVNVQGVAELDRLPVMERVHIRDNMTELLSDAIDIRAALACGDLELGQTSGSSGMRLVVISDMKLHRAPPFFEQVWNLGEMEQLPKTAVLTSPACSGVCGHKQPLNRHGMVLSLKTAPSPFAMSNNKITELIQNLDEFRPDLLLAHPTYLYWFILRARELGLCLPPIRAILMSYQLAGRNQRRMISEALDAPIYDQYAAGDLGGCQIGVECRYGHMHLREDHVIMEIRAPRGEIGPVFLTTVGAKLMPLIRYRLGDVAQFTDHQCDCELSDWQTVILHGREQDSLYLGSRWWTTRQVDEILSEVDGLDLYRVIQPTSGHPDSDSLVVQVIPTARDVDHAEIVDRLRALGARSVCCESVREFPSNRSMKFSLTSHA